MDTLDYLLSFARDAGQCVGAQPGAKVGEKSTTDHPSECKTGMDLMVIKLLEAKKSFVLLSRRRSLNTVLLGRLVSGV